MITHTLDENASILHVCPSSPLTKEDFQALAKQVDPFIEKAGGLKGLLLDVPHFPGWQDFQGMLGHFRFVRDHHRRIQKIAAVTNSALGSAAEHIAAHFVAATIKHFTPDKMDQARKWLQE